MHAPRVVIVSHTAQLGGGEIALLRLLAGFDADDFDLSVVLFEDGPLVQRLRDSAIRTEIVPLGELNNVTRHAGSVSSSLRNAAGALGFVPRLARAVRRHRPDLLVANTLKAATLLSAAAPLAGTPWVWHLHDRLAGDYLPERTARALRLIARSMPRHVVVNSLATLATLGRIRRSRATVAYPGLERPLFVGRSRPEDGGAIGMLGRISETKGQLEFVEAAAIVAASHPDARFSITGAALFQDGDYERRVRERITSSGLGGRTELVGWTDDPAAAMRRLRVFVHASPVPEPFGQVIVEAMASGVPVIATSGGGVPEILDPASDAVDIADGVSLSELGLLVRAGDPSALAAALAWAIDHPDDLAAMSDRALASARTRFDIADARRIVQTAWISAIPRRRRPPRAVR